MFPTGKGMIGGDGQDVLVEVLKAFTFPVASASNSSFAFSRQAP